MSHLDKPGHTPIRSLDPKYYLDPTIHDLVRDKLYYRSWQYACHQSQIPETGCYFAFDIMDEGLFIARQRDGSVRCFYNVCQHRAHTMVSDSGKASVIACPYHAWTYELDGNLRAAPGTKAMSNFNKSDICLTEVKVENFLGFLFVNLDEDSASMDETFPGLRADILAHCPDIEDRIFAHEHTAPEFCNWMIAVENYNECYHCKVVHPTFASGVIDASSYNIRADDGGARVLRHTADANRGESAWYDTSGAGYKSFFFWPAFSLQCYPSGLINTYHWRPEDVNNTTVHRGWLSQDGLIDDAMQKVIDLDRDTTFAEDLVLVKQVHKGLKSRGYRPGPLVLNPAEGIDSEHSIATLHTWLKEAVEA
jgi:phenylpropionate dioxygenase-like ring-hydroxylating dioxygenase large terminal subunit